MAEIIVRATGATREDLAWAAGLFEGEGCISVSGKGPSLAPSCCLGMTDEDIVRKFHRIIGKGSVLVRKPVPRADGTGHYKAICAWRTAGFRSTQYVIALLWNWLGARRRQRAAEILTRFRTFPIRRPKSCKYGHDLSLPGARNASGYCTICQARRHAKWYASGGKAVRQAYNRRIASNASTE